jgi:hypothetical protein
MTRRRHPSGTTTPKIRREIQNSPESTAALGRRLKLNPKTIAKWRSRRRATDLAMGPRRRLTLLSEEDETTIVVFRRFTRLPLNDCLKRLKPIIPHLSRSALHRCLRRYAVSRIPRGYAKSHPKMEGRLESGHFTLDIHKVKEGYVFTAISLTCFIHAEFKKKASATSAMSFVKGLIEHAPSTIRSVETKNYAAFTASDPDWDDQSSLGPQPFHAFCRKREIDHFAPETGKREPGPVPKGWGRVLRRPIANRSFEPMSRRRKQPQTDHVEVAEVIADDPLNWTDTL